MMQLPAIVIPTYNRAYSLERLLHSVSQARFTEKNIPLVISIDKSDAQEVYRLAENFAWKHGEKKIIQHEIHLGLKEHILRCGDLSQTHGAVIILEDDLFVSPHFYDYALQALNFYKEQPEEKLAGISLFNYEVAENCFCPFEPYADDSDVYFMQMASSWGQCWTAEQWKLFRTWFAANEKILSTENLPDYILQWSETSWKKHFVRYLIAADKYFTFPRVSLSTNFGEPGTNTDRRGLFQSALLTHEKKFQFTSLSNSLSVYDASFEMKTQCFKKIAPAFTAYDLEVDLYGTKKLSEVKAPFLLSSKPCKNSPQSFGNELKPLISNIVSQNVGSIFHLAAKENFTEAEIDKQIFYPSVASVADIVFYEKIKALSESRIQEQLNESRYREEVKEIAVVVFNTAKDKSYLKTLQSIREQNYPHLQLVFVTDENIPVELDDLKDFKNTIIIKTKANGLNAKEYRSAIQKTSSSFFIQVNAGDVFLPDTFHSVNKVFRQFSFIHLLTGLAQINSVAEKLPAKRINKNIFLKNRGGSSVPSSFFFDRYVLEKAFNEVSSDSVFSQQQLLYQLLCADALYTTPQIFSQTETSSAPFITNENPDWSFADSLAQFFFENDTTYLRYFFQHWQQLPPVVRYEVKTDSYYLSTY